MIILLTTTEKFELFYVKIDFQLDFSPTLQALITSEFYLKIIHFDLNEFSQRGIEYYFKKI